ncbi:hypothetical protein SS50377_27374 [Spironucleus salmonicida]|uniref:Uncharacterized protein n=1 Tax=Spironucleus salmonicida TaxID=348837 RepID=V6LRB5_9EUKA|nr:hypothetical protein SS50377_27374 [Spironucleus salmonicida]|eukprot:EST43324.1 hypothetical protein SS50377_17001 [Spironucleus salmonicida]
MSDPQPQQYKRFQAEVQGIFRFVLLSGESFTVQQLIQQAEEDFQATYNLAKCPKFVKLQMDDQEIHQTTPCDRLNDMQRIQLVPEQLWIDLLKRQPWDLLGIDEGEFEVRVELMRKVFGDDANTGVLRSCLLRASGNLGKAVAVGSYIRPDLMGTTKKVVFVRPRIEK